MEIDNETHQILLRLVSVRRTAYSSHRNLLLAQCCYISLLNKARKTTFIDKIKTTTKANQLNEKNKLWLNKDNLQRAGIEPATSGLPTRVLYKLNNQVSDISNTKSHLSRFIFYYSGVGEWRIVLLFNYYPAEGRKSAGTTTLAVVVRGDFSL